MCTNFANLRLSLEKSLHNQTGKIAFTFILKWKRNWMNKNGLSMKEQSTSKNISVRVFFKSSKISLWRVHCTVHFSYKFLMVYKLLGRIQLSYQCDWQYRGITVRKCQFVQRWQNITDRNSYKCQMGCTTQTFNM